MAKMSEIIGRQLAEFSVGPDYTRPHPHTSVGIEVELERIVDPPQFLKRWHLERDGSLQNGTEFISEPVWGTAITDALVELEEFLDTEKPLVSFRTSVHVHVNMLDMQAAGMARMLKGYLLYEPALFRLHEDWNRHNNIFCVPARESVIIQKGYGMLLRDLERGHVSTGYINSKYSALNPNCLRSLGTLEFRHMGGTTDVKKISDWIDILLQLKTAAILEADMSDPKDVWGDLHDKLDVRPDDLIEGQSIINKIRMWR